MLLRFVVRVRTSGFLGVFRRLFGSMSYSTKEHNLVEQLMIFDAKFEEKCKAGKETKWAFIQR